MTAQNVDHRAHCHEAHQRTEYEHKGLEPEEALHFRLFAKKGSDYGLASDSCKGLRRQHRYAGQGAKTWRRSKDGAGRSSCHGWPLKTMAAPTSSSTASLVNELDEDDDQWWIPNMRANIVTVACKHGDMEKTQTNCSRLGEPANMPISIDGSNNRLSRSTRTPTMATFSGLAQESRWQFEVYALNEASD